MDKSHPAAGLPNWAYWSLLKAGFTRDELALGPSHLADCVVLRFPSPTERARRRILEALPSRRSASDGRGRR